MKLLSILALSAAAFIPGSQYLPATTGLAGSAMSMVIMM